MTYFVPGLVIGFLLGAIAFGIFALMLLAFKRPAPPPTFHHRREWRDRSNAPGTEFVEVPAEVRWEARATDDGRGVRYEHLGMTGEEV